MYLNNIRAKYSSSGFGMAVVAIHLKFRLYFQLLGSVTFSEIYLIKVILVIKGANRRHFCFLFCKCPSFSSIFFQCPVFSCRPSVYISFSLISYFFPLWPHFCPPFNPFSSFFLSLHSYCICFHSYSFSNLYSPSFFLSLSFLFCSTPC